MPKRNKSNSRLFLERIPTRLPKAHAATGVKAQNLDIDLRENVLTLAGEAGSPESQGERDVLREYETGRYVRQFNLSDAIDQSKIDAELREGVLRLVLPKAEKAVPRKIAVRAG